MLSSTTLNNYINKRSYLCIELVRSTSEGSYLVIFTLANREVPDQAALKAAWSGSALFAKVLKVVSMR